ncbi:hypothetical protein HY409_00935 [Candidatus Gottesmanbacteria bacterium]|nr:hypothetical protein [Candidatus Gottesmanbacteria bacterium]
MSFFKFLVVAFVLVIGTMAATEKAGAPGGVLVFFVGVGLAIASEKWGLWPVLRVIVVVLTALLRLVSVVGRLLISLLSRAARFLIMLGRQHWRWEVTVAGIIGAVIFMLSPSISASVKVYGFIAVISIAMLIFTVMSKRRSLYRSKHSRRH